MKNNLRDELNTMKMHIVYLNNPKRNSPIIDITEHFDVSIQVNGRALLHKNGLAPLINLALNMDDSQTVELVDYECVDLCVDAQVFLKWIKRMDDFYRHAFIISQKEGKQPPFIGFWNAIIHSRPYNYLSSQEVVNDFNQWREQAMKFDSGDFLDGYDRIAEAFGVASRNGGVWMKRS